MQTLPYILMQDRLSTGGSFILCDANAQGFPIRYASQGFVELFGFPASECVGRKCGDLVAAPIAQDPDGAGLASGAGLSQAQVAQGLKFLTEFASEEVQKMIANPTEHVAFAMVLNRGKNREVFVCELVMHSHHHPAFGWSYCVGLQRDATKEVSVAKLLHAAVHGGYAELIKNHEVAMRERVARLGVFTDQAVHYLHEKAGEMWQTLSHQDCKQLSEISGALSTAYSSTDEASSCDDSFETSSVASSSRLSNRGRQESSKVLAGVWKGTVSEALGSYEQVIEFCPDGVSARVQVRGRTAVAEYSLDTSRTPHHLDLRVLPPPGSVPESSPLQPPLCYIARVEGNRLHLCCPFPTPERPTAFEGPGYCLMHRAEEAQELQAIPEARALADAGRERMAPMQTMPYILMQDRLSTGGSFILCDANAQGFPIRYASQGFVDLFGYKAAECVGRRCGDLVAAPIAKDPDMAGLGKGCGLSKADVAKGLDFLTEHAASEVREMMANPAEHVAFALVLNRRKNQRVFVCELVMHAHQHPTFGWSYCVGLQSDATREVSIAKLLKAAVHGGYEELVKGRRASMRQRVGRLGIGSDQAIRYLDEKAGEMWQTLVQGQEEKEIKGLGEIKLDTECSTIWATSESNDSESEDSRSCSNSSVAASLGFSNEGTKESSKVLAGVWKGVVSKALGAYEQTVELADDGVSARIEVMGRSADATYSLDTSRQPYRLDLRVLPPAGSVAKETVLPPPMLYIVRIDGDALYLCCCPYASRQRPLAFEGPGYVEMRRIRDRGDASIHDLAPIPESDDGVYQRGSSKLCSSQPELLKQVSAASTDASHDFQRGISDGAWSTGTGVESHIEFTRGISVEATSGVPSPKATDVPAQDQPPRALSGPALALLTTTAIAMLLLMRRRQ
mmetsp:Transcript_50491/g.130066  ORF Transcript_50491/g.130066 Transcript_50491/m.130066 type:complete len:905 (+) Transcript_50491:74-2788(+)